MDDTTTIVFESACFDGSSVQYYRPRPRHAYRRLLRYEKGLDPNNCLPALERACELVELLDAGDVLDDVMVDDHSSHEQRRIPLETEWTNGFLNIHLSAEEMKAINEKLTASLTEIPSWYLPSGLTWSTKQISWKNCAFLRLQ